MAEAGFPVLPAIGVPGRLAASALTRFIVFHAFGMVAVVIPAILRRRAFACAFDPSSRVIDGPSETPVDIGTDRRRACPDATVIYLDNRLGRSGLVPPAMPNAATLNSSENEQGISAPVA